jgi:hypothetical protein
MSNPSEQGDVPASPAEVMAAAFAAALAPMTAALQNLSVAPPTTTASNVSAPPVVAAPAIHLPANTIKLPVFKGTMPDPRSTDRIAEISKVRRDRLSRAGAGPNGPFESLAGPGPAGPAVVAPRQLID